MISHSRKPVVGDLVYFHAFVDPEDESTYFLCKGYIIREPKKDSPIYKLVVTAVDPRSVLCGARPDVAKKLLCKKIVRAPEQLSTEPTGWMLKFYQRDWLEISEAELRKIEENIKRKCLAKQS